MPLPGFVDWLNSNENKLSMLEGGDITQLITKFNHNTGGENTLLFGLIRIYSKKISKYNLNLVKIFHDC